MRRERGPFRYRRLQMMEGLGNDAYRPGAKPPGPVHCPGCGVVFRKGRWSWGVEHAFKGEVSRSYNREDNLLRVRWRRDA